MSTSLSLENIITTRWEKLPTVCKDIFLDPEFEKEIANIAAYYKINQEQYEQLKNEAMLVLFLFEPITQLSKNIMHELGVSNDIAVAIASEIELMALYTASDFLYKIARDSDFVGIRSENTPQIQKMTPEAMHSGVSQEIVHTEVNSKQEQNSPKPLTREEVLKAITPTRTMANDIQTVAKGGSAPVQGYEAYQQTKKTD